MRPGERLALGIVLILVVVVGGAAGAATYAWQQAGTVRVSVHESGPDGSDVSLRMPAVLLNLAIAFCPTPHVLDDPDAASALGVLEAVADELVSMPDAVLVDVREPGTTVRIEKRDGRLLVRVREPGERVDIEVPIGSVRMLAAKLGRAGRARAA
jgi:hypothetical protein